MDGEYGLGRCKLLHLEWISNGVLLYSTGNYVQSLGLSHDGRWYEKKIMCIYVWLDHFVVQQKLKEYCILTLKFFLKFKRFYGEVDVEDEIPNLYIWKDNVEKSLNNERPLGIPIVAQWVKNPTSIHDEEVLIPGLTQWVKDLVLSWVVV